MFRPLLITDVDKATINKLIEEKKIEKLFNYLNELVYQSYQNGVSQGFSMQDEKQNILIGRLTVENNELRQYAPPLPKGALGDESHKAKKL